MIRPFLLLILPVALAAQVPIEIDVPVTFGPPGTSDGSAHFFENPTITGPVFVLAGASLTILPGTIVTFQRDPFLPYAPAIFITRDAQIFADGTPESPVVFTIPADGDGHPLLSAQIGSWGGLFLLGNAILNDAGNPATGGSEIPSRRVDGPSLAALDPDALLYGGGDDNDSSGRLRYVSLRYAGAAYAVDSEAAGLTLAGVGRGTELDHIEVIGSTDAGVRFLGGTVDSTHLVSVFHEGNTLVWDEGFRGRGQFWFVLTSQGDSVALEMDGGNLPDPELPPYAAPRILNATILGAGVTSGDHNLALLFSENSGGRFHNSIIADFGGPLVSITTDSDDRVAAGDLDLSHNLFFGFGVLDPPEHVEATLSEDTIISLAGGFASDAERAALAGNLLADPQLASIDRSGLVSGLDPRPAEDGPAFSAARYDASDDPWFTTTDFIGAFRDRLWLRGWTRLDEMGLLPDPVLPTEPSLRILAISRSESRIRVEVQTIPEVPFVLQISSDGFYWTDVTSIVYSDEVVYVFEMEVAEERLFLRAESR